LDIVPEFIRNNTNICCFPGNLIIFVKNKTLMDIQDEKKNLIEWILKVEDPSVLYKIKQLKEDSLNQNKTTLPPNQGERDSIRRGLEDFDNNNTHSHQKARDIYAKYL